MSEAGWFNSFLADQGVNEPWFESFAGSRGVTADPPPKKKKVVGLAPKAPPDLPAWMQATLDHPKKKREVADGAYVAPAQLPALSTIGPLLERNRNQPDISENIKQPGVEYLHGDMRDLLTQTSGGAGLLDFVPGLGEARGLAYANELKAQGQPIMAHLVGGLSAVPGGAAAGRKLAKRALKALVPGNFRNERGMVGAWHGSPHKFDKFSMDKVGTGEGAQAYGHGLYFTDKKDIAEHYRKSLAPKTVFRNPKGDEFDAYDLAKKNPNTPEGYAASSLMQAKSIDEALEKVMQASPNDFIGGADEKAATYAGLSRYKDAGYERVQAGHSYKVDLDVEPDDLLDWDKPLSEQPPKVRSALVQMGYDGNTLSGQTGSGLYRSITGSQWDRLGKPHTAMTTSEAQAAASTALKQAGIKGIRYRDGSSRDVRLLRPEESMSGKWTVGPAKGAKDQQQFFDNEAEALEAYKAATSHNYVIFDDAAVNIKERGWATAATLAGAGAGAGAALTGGLLLSQPDSTPRRGLLDD